MERRLGFSRSTAKSSVSACFLMASTIFGRQWPAFTPQPRCAVEHAAAVVRGVVHMLGADDEAAEIAEAYLYLMRQTYSTGQGLIVDGGAVL